LSELHGEFCQHCDLVSAAEVNLLVNRRLSWQITIELETVESVLVSDHREDSDSHAVWNQTSKRKQKTQEKCEISETRKLENGLKKYRNIVIRKLKITIQKLSLIRP
jgi:hypothetical protein